MKSNQMNLEFSSLMYKLKKIIINEIIVFFKDDLMKQICKQLIFLH